MPMPGPMSCHWRRSLGLPSASLGYHRSGTDTLRPSRSSTMSTSLVTRTRLAAAASAAGLEVVMPRLQQHGLVFLDQRRNLGQLILSEATVVLQPDVFQPELGGLPLSRYVNMSRFAPVAGKEKEAVRTALQNCRTHVADSASFPRMPPRNCCDVTRKLPFSLQAA